MNRFSISLIYIVVCMSITGCLSKPDAPIPYLTYKNPNTLGENKKLLVFLRGFGGNHEIFKKHGLVDAVFDNTYPFDIVAPNAHMGYYKSETLGKRLHDDIIAPARAQGYKEIWLVGTSLGGLGALIYLTDYADSVDGVILLSPFLGWGGIIDEINDAGGLKAWQPGLHTVEDWQRYLWAWIKVYDTAEEKKPEIYLGYGKSDFFTASQELFSGVIPQGHTTIVDGWHTYSTLRQLWKDYMSKMNARFRQ